MPKDVPSPVGPYRPAVGAGPFVFVSGQIPLDPETGTLAGPDTRSQTERALRNLESVLESVGLELSDVVKTTVFMVDLAEFEEMNEVYGAFFRRTPPPARSTVQVSALPKGARIEIEAVAAKE